MNFDMAAELAEIEGIRVENVVATDDVASMPKGSEHQRRGVAGMFYLYKLAAAKAESGGNFDESSALPDIDIKSGSDLSVLVNGLGTTPLEELYIIYRNVHKLLEGKGIRVYKNYVGEYATSLEMAGLSISILILDEELKKLIDMPFTTPFHKQN